MASLNRIVLVGKLAADPESRSTVEGLAMAKFRLSINRSSGLAAQNYSASGNDVFDVVCWRSLAEVVGNALKKGQLVLVEGKIQTRTFEDQSGQKKWATEIVASNIYLLDKAIELNKAKPAANEEDEDVPEDMDLASELPF